MDDIIQYDVRTYVEALIQKEFLSKKNKEKVVLENRKTDTGENRKVQSPFAAVISK